MLGKDLLFKIARSGGELLLNVYKGTALLIGGLKVGTGMLTKLIKAIATKSSEYAAFLRRAGDKVLAAMKGKKVNQELLNVGPEAEQAAGELSAGLGRAVSDSGATAAETRAIITRPIMNLDGPVRDRVLALPEVEAVIAGPKDPNKWYAMGKAVARAGGIGALAYWLVDETGETITGGEFLPDLDIQDRDRDTGEGVDIMAWTDTDEGASSGALAALQCEELVEDVICVTSIGAEGLALLWKMLAYGAKRPALLKVVLEKKGANILWEMKTFSQ
jgi:hypothetical protein